jgi:hypothetical protein
MRAEFTIWFGERLAVHGEIGQSRQQLDDPHNSGEKADGAIP